MAAEAKPFLKWVGGKGRLLPQLFPLLPEDWQKRNFIEPFLGGGAMFFALKPVRALLSDVNRDLVDTYREVRDRVDLVISHLAKYQALYNELEGSSEFYYDVRACYNKRAIYGAQRAAAFIFLNKTCFNGLYRVNKRGSFNTPAGRFATPPTILDEENLLACSKRLRRAEIHCRPFEAPICPSRNDFVYFDPPYDPVSETADFTSYAVDGFSRHDQERLRDYFAACDRRGAKLMLSNSDTSFIRTLYKDWNITTISVARSINRDATKRGVVPEVVVRNY